MATHDSGARGEYADRPLAVPMRGWGNVARRVVRDISEDNLSIVAAGTAFFGLLAAFPAIAAFVTLYGLLADPATVEAQIAPLQGVMPPAAFGILAEQLRAVAAQEPARLGLGFAVSLALTWWSAISGVKTLMTALNIAYDERETRGFFRLNGVALLFTVGAMAVMALSLFVIAAIPAIVGVLALSEPLAGLALWTRWLAMALVVVAALAVLYRYGPARRAAKWRWVAPGAAAATLLWLAVSVGFSAYVANFGTYNETFGSLGAGVILLMWFYLSAYVICVGAELNAELERQTRRDTTIGPARPRGQRGASVADRAARQG